MVPYQATMIAERRPIVFRADASEGVGGGHVVRCLTLATAWAEEGWHVGFAVNACALSVVPALAGSVVDILVLNESDAGTDEASTLAERWPDGVALLVVDHYGRDATFERSCQPWADAIMAIDDLADRHHCANFLLDQTPGREARDYDGLVPPGCAMLLGGRYALIRPSFAARRTANRAARANSAAQALCGLRRHRHPRSHASYDRGGCACGTRHRRRCGDGCRRARYRER